MYKIPKTVHERISQGIKKFQPILKAAKSRDDNEANTVTIITDILFEVLGYEKYSEITSEYSIKNTFCDLATKVNGKVTLLIEVKAIGIDLKEDHMKQAVHYAADAGLDWVILTNGNNWRVYKMKFSKPIDTEFVFEFDFLDLSSKKIKDIELLFPLSKEGTSKSSLEIFHDQKQTLNKYFLGALITSDNILSTMKRELKKSSPTVKIEEDEIKDILLNEVIKRDVLDSDEVKDARKKINRINRKKSKPKKQILKSKQVHSQNTLAALTVINTNHGD